MHQRKINDCSDAFTMLVLEGGNTRGNCAWGSGQKNAHRLKVPNNRKAMIMFTGPTCDNRNRYCHNINNDNAGGEGANGPIELGGRGQTLNTINNWPCLK